MKQPTRTASPEWRIFESREPIRGSWAWPIFVPMLMLLGVFAFTHVDGGARFGADPARDRPAIYLCLVIGLGLGFLLARIRVRVLVTNRHVYVTCGPLRHRRIDLEDILTHARTEVRPYWQFGGYGARFRRALGWAFLSDTGHGVQLTLRRGRPVFLGNRRADALEIAIAQARGLEPARVPEAEVFA